MDSAFERLLSCRKNLVSILNHYSIQDLNTIPLNASNNIIWNVTHSLVTQQLLHYYLSGNPMQIDESWVNAFKKGPRPEKEYDQKFVNLLVSELLNTVEKLKDDYHKGIFKEYQQYATSFGYEINNIDQAIAFNNMHESMHLGYVLSLKNELK